MRPQNLIGRLLDWWRRLPTYFCDHDYRLDLSDCLAWDRCSTEVTCVKCGADHRIYVALDSSAADDVMNYRAEAGH